MHSEVVLVPQPPRLAHDRRANAELEVTYSAGHYLKEVMARKGGDQDEDE